MGTSLTAEDTQNRERPLMDDIFSEMSEFPDFQFSPSLDSDVLPEQKGITQSLPSTPVTQINEQQKHVLEVADYRIGKFVLLPFHLEVVIYFGIFICVDLFLDFFARQIYQALITIFTIGNSFMQLKFPKVTRQQMIKLLLILQVFTSALALLEVLPLSYYYHYIRQESTFKLYVIFNILQIFDKLGSAFGQDLHDAVVRSNKRILSSEFLTALLCYWIYLVTHAGMLFIQLVVLNVVINSSTRKMYTLLVSTNFSELKSAVFKKFPPKVMFQITCSDISERFQLFVFLVCVFANNYATLDESITKEWLWNCAFVFLIMFVAEHVVDWLKHGFLCKFNVLDVSMYKSFRYRLCKDLLEHKARTANPPRLNRRLGLVRFPLVILVLRVFFQHYNPVVTMWRSLWFGFWASLILFFVKLILGVTLQKYSAWNMASLREFDNNIAKESDDLENIYRYKLCYKRIPV